MASDNFTRANENPLASPWGSCGTGDLRVVSNQCANASGTDTTSYMRYTTSSTLTSIVNFAVVGANTDAGPCVCLDGSGNGYAFLNSANFQLYIFKLPGFGTVVNVGGSNFNTSDAVELRREGNDLVGYVAGAEVIRGTDTDFMTGNDGIFQYQGANRISLWQSGGAPPAGLVVNPLTGRGGGAATPLAV